MSERTDEKKRLSRSRALTVPTGLRWSSCRRCGTRVPFDRQERLARCPGCDELVHAGHRLRMLVLVILILCLLAIGSAWLERR